MKAKGMKAAWNIHKEHLLHSNIHWDLIAQIFKVRVFWFIVVLTSPRYQEEVKYIHQSFFNWKAMSVPNKYTYYSICDNVKHSLNFGTSEIRHMHLSKLYTTIEDSR